MNGRAVAGKTTATCIKQSFLLTLLNVIDKLKLTKAHVFKFLIFTAVLTE